METLKYKTVEQSRVREVTVRRPRKDLWKTCRFESAVKRVELHRVPQKGCHQTHGGNFVKSQPIFTIPLPL